MCPEGPLVKDVASPLSLSSPGHPLAQLPPPRPPVGLRLPRSATPAFLQRLALVVVPGVVVVVLAATVAWGEKGVMRLVELRVELRDANAQLRAIERKNQRLIRDLHALEQDRTAVERVVAEELGWATSESTLYRFAESEAP